MNTKSQRNRRLYISIEMNQTSLSFSMVRQMDISKISQEERSQSITYYVIRPCNLEYDEYQLEIASMIYKLFDKKSGKTVKGIKESENQNLVNQLHKSTTRKFQVHKVYSSCQEQICDADLAEVLLTCRFNKGIIFVLRIIDIYSKYAQLVSLKEKKALQASMYSIKICLSLGVNQTRYGQIRVVSLIIDQFSHGCMTMALECIQHIMKE